MEPKVSIVVPVYGVEKYITECIVSLQQQTYENLEIILVDDGGKDQSPEICDHYAAQDQRIMVIHKPNGGAASARNAGLDAATGDYICFVDGDDVVAPEYVQHLLTQAKDHNADIAVCGFRNLTKSGAEQMNSDKIGIYTRQEYLLHFLESWTCALLWDKIYRKETIGNIRMEEGHKIDDEFFTYLVVMNSQKIVVTDVALYDYRLRKSSVMQDSGPHRERIFMDRVEYMTARYGNIAQGIPEIEPQFFMNTWDTMTRYWYHSKGFSKVRQEIRRWFRAHTGRLLHMPIPLRSKLIRLYQVYFGKTTANFQADAMQVETSDCFD